MLSRNQQLKQTNSSSLCCRLNLVPNNLSNPIASLTQQLSGGPLVDSAAYGV